MEWMERDIRGALYSLVVLLVVFRVHALQLRSCLLASKATGPTFQELP